MAKPAQTDSSKIARVRANIHYSHEAIGEFCQYWGIVELALFGSVLRDNFSEASDIDVLVTFDPKKHITLFDMVDMGEALEHIFGRKVDLISRRSIERSENYLRRENILGNLEIIYATG